MASRRNPQEDGRNFFRRLAREGAFSRVFVVYGEEGFLIREASQRIHTAIFPDGSNGLNVDNFDGREHGGPAIVSAARSMPMFADQRLVRVLNADKLKAADLDDLARYVADPSESTTLLLCGASFDRRKKATKALFAAKSVVSVEFAFLRDRETEGWVARRAKSKYGLIVARDVPGLLVEAIGTSLDLLDTALERVDLFVGGDRSTSREVSRSLIEELVVDTRTRAWFEMTDALLERRIADAIRQFHHAHRYGESAIPTVSRVGFQFRTVLLMHEGARRGLSGNDLTNFAECRSFLAKKYQQAARRYTGPELRFILRRIAETDAALKSSRLADLTHVDRLFLDIGSARTLATGDALREP